ncbi:MAG: hypothetical protein IJ193_07410 [Bacilli bacterium]|nr:hypothetical protein [Bacilli bacterium]
MILVVLGTQDKEFPRLLEAVESCIEDGTIKDKVVVQAGQTKYESKNMEIFDLLPAPEFEKLMDEADVIITHGGAGTILSAIKKGKRVIAAARLEKYKEHHNDHQKQIIGEFADKGYILELKDFHKLDVMLKKAKTFKPKKFESNTDNMISLIEDYIKEDNHTSWYHKYQSVFWYILFGVLAYFLYQVGIYQLSYLDSISINLKLVCGSILLLILYFPMKYICFSYKANNVSELCFRFVLYFLFNLGIFVLCTFLPQYLSAIVFLIGSYLFNRYLIFSMK